MSTVFTVEFPPPPRRRCGVGQQGRTRARLGPREAAQFPLCVIKDRRVPTRASVLFRRGRTVHTVLSRVQLEGIVTVKGPRGLSPAQVPQFSL